MFNLMLLSSGVSGLILLLIFLLVLYVLLLLFVVSPNMKHMINKGKSIKIPKLFEWESKDA